MSGAGDDENAPFGLTYQMVDARAISAHPSEPLSVGDADNIDRFDAYRIHEMLVHDKFLEMSFEEKANLVNTRIEKLNKAKQMELGTKTAERIWAERIAYYIGFYEKLQKQLGNSTAIN